VLLVVDGADDYRSSLVPLLDRLFHRCQQLRVLSTATQLLTGHPDGREGVRYFSY